MENQLKVKYKVGEIEFEAEGTPEDVEHQRIAFMDTILPAAVDAMVRTRGVVADKQYLSAQEPVLLGEGTGTTQTSNGQKDDLSRTSLSSFISDYGTLSEQDFVLIAAYYDEQKNGTSFFTIENVKKYYGDARRTEYSNISELLRQLAIRGLIMDNPGATAKSPKQYILSEKGITYVKNYTPKDDSTGKKKTSSKPRKPSTALSSVYAGLNLDELNIKNYPEVKSLTKFKEKMLLVMYIVTNAGKGDSFSVNDLQCLITDIWGFPATANQIKGVFTQNKSWFKQEEDPRNKGGVVRKLLQGGKDFAQEIIDSSKSKVNNS